MQQQTSSVRIASNMSSRRTALKLIRPYSQYRRIELCFRYVSGWLRRGPSGIVGTNITDAKETAASLLEDHAAGKLHACEKVMPGLHVSLLPSCGACEGVLCCRVAWIRSFRR
jgi:hypothetical protein